MITKPLKRKHLLLGVALASAMAAGIAYAFNVLDPFELDGNAVTATTHDWDQIYCDHIDPTRTGTCIGVPASGALVSSFLTDPVESPMDDIFDGAKDSLDIKAGAPQDWHWKVGEPNDKNDIEHGYAAIYNTIPADNSGDFILYFGLDKLSNNGDAAIGFWFLQNEVTQVGTADRGNPFSAGHVPGDILVQADIASGGDVDRDEAYTWVAGGADATAITNNCAALGGIAVAPSQGGLCRILGAGATQPGGGLCVPGTDPDLCAIMNKAAVPAPWPYLFKFSGGVAPSPDFQVATFFEGGLNLSKIFPQGIPCISSFLAETRQSQSETAELEDKLLGKFDLCSLSVKKEGPEKSKKGDTVTYTITITNDGALPLNKVSIIDNKLGDLTSQCGATLAPHQSCVIVFPFAIPMNAPDPLVNTVTATYLRDTATIDTTVVGTASHTTDLINPSVTLDKKANGSDGPLTVLQGATLPYTILVRNTSSADTPPLTCTITDPLLGVNQVVVLASGQSTTVNASKTFLTADTPFINTASTSCTPEGFPNTVTASDSVTVNVVPSANALAVDKSGPQFSKVGDTVTYTIRIDNIGGVQVTLTLISDTLLGDLSSQCPAPLPPGGFCQFTIDRAVQAGDPDPLVNTVTVTGTDGLGGTAGPISDSHIVDLVHPSFALTKDCLTDPVPQGESANFRIRIANTGDVNLLTDVSDAVLGINQLDVVLGTRGGAACAESDYDGDPSDGCYQIEAGIIATGTEVNNTVDVHGTLPASFGLANAIDHSAGATCPVTTAGATRTWGFWKTHGSDGQKFDDPVAYGYTCHVFEDHLGSSVNLGWKVLTNCNQVFGLFWADPARDPATGKNRDQICKTALHTSQMLLAAILNDALSNGATLDPALKAATIAALSACADNNSATTCDRNLLTNLAGQLNVFNSSGDTVAIIDADGATIPHADPRGTRDVADYSISSCPIP